MKKEEEGVSLREIYQLIRPAFSGTFFRYFFIMLGLAVASLGAIAEPLIYGKVIDTVVSAVQKNTLESLWSAMLPLLGLWIVVDVVASAARELANVASWKTAGKVWSRFWKATLEKVLWWDPQRFTVVSVGGLAKQLDNAGSATWRIAGTTLQQIFPIIFGTVSFFVVGFSLDWRMTLASLAGIPPLFFMSLFAQKKVEKKQNAVNEAWEEFLQKFVEILSGIVPIKACAAEDRTAHMHMKIGEEAQVRQQKVDKLWAALGFGTSFTRFFGRFVLLGAGLYFISEGTLTLGTLVTFMGMLDIVLAPFEHLMSELMRRISETRSTFSRVYPELKKENLINDKKNAKKAKKILGEIAFERVSFKYPEKTEEALKNISLHIEKGTSLALVGPSGSGKSTLVKFVNRFLDPDEGVVKIDGKDCKDFRQEDIRKAVGFVHQDTILFNVSVKENVKFALPNATEKEVINACKQAQAHDFIMRLKDGYETVLGERGVRLSGGERQRIAIARVLLANQPILVLDESTSALDSETEIKLQKALQKAMKGRTTIIIAHRLSTIYMADKIAVMERGEIKEIGTHDELLRQVGLYERLWKMQSGGYFDKE